MSPAIQHDVSAPLRDMQGVALAGPTTKAQKPLHVVPNRGNAVQQPDSALQTTAGTKISITPGLNIAGVGNCDYGFVPNAAPPDTNGAVGATQYVQWVNESFAVFNKTTGALVFGPVAGNTLPYLQCVAVSTTSDATGTWARYAFSQPNFPDYPKLGVWTDGYYLSFNMFIGNTFVGARACAFDRTAMLTGSAANQICFQLSSAYRWRNLCSAAGHQAAAGLARRSADAPSRVSQPWRSRVARGQPLGDGRLERGGALV